jgi:two-component system, OmpR family, phosphate regulon sensor histidine kinase PhoR
MQNFNRVNRILVASTIAVIALIIIQVQWMRQSRDLLEEGFNNRVKMALCSAIERLNDETDIEVSSTCAKIEGVNESNIKELEVALQKSLMFYNIDLPFNLSLIQGKKIQCSMFSCAINPYASLEKADNMEVTIFFPNKNKYLLGKMGFMLTASILILLFVVGVLWFANATLLRQKRISEINVDFFNNMAHEFRTPLTSIKLAMNLLIKKQASLKDNNYLGIIQRESQKLHHQIESVLHLAKMEGGEYELQKEPVALQELLQKTIQCMEMQLQAKNAVVHFVPSEGDWTIIADGFHLGNAFRNLIDNALKYNEKQPIIHISLEKDKDSIHVFFEDNGIGIAKPNQEMIFDKFHRIKNGNRHDVKGFGLGLAYVKMIVERHKGAIKIFSELQMGSRFDLMLPIA